MLDKKFYIIAIILSLATILTFGYSSYGQRPPRDRMEWFLRVDTNKNDNIEPEEYKTAANEIFRKLDRNNDGVIDEVERPRNPRPRDEGLFSPNRPLPGPPPIPFFVMESIKQPGDVTRAEFDENINEQFKLMDKNGDGVVSREEAQNRFKEVDDRVQNEQRPDDIQPLDSQTAKFISAEVRFGDKFIKGAPFSAETVIENTRRLFDGSTVTKTSKGAIYRDGSGRTRREQPIEANGGFSVVGENGSPQKLIFINDFIGKAHYFLDLNRRTAVKNPLPDDRP